MPSVLSMWLTFCLIGGPESRKRVVFSSMSRVSCLGVWHIPYLVCFYSGRAKNLNSYFPVWLCFWMWRQRTHKSWAVIFEIWAFWCISRCSGARGKTESLTLNSFWVNCRIRARPCITNISVIMPRISTVLGFSVSCLHYCCRFEGQGSPALLRLKRARVGSHCWVIKPVCLPRGSSPSFWIHSLKFWIPSLFENNTFWTF